MERKGLTDQEVNESRIRYGSNALTQLPGDPLWKKVLMGFKDPMILILLLALAVQITLFFMGEVEWFEPLGIFFAILIANGVSSFSEYKQEEKASSMKAEDLAKEKAKILRQGQLLERNISEIVVGDLVYLQAGDKIPADGLMIEGSLKVDQSALNGETEEAEKLACPENAEYDSKDLWNPYYIYRGTVVVAGEGFMQVKSVGDQTLFGQLALEVQEEGRATPLQVKLADLAKKIARFGYIGSIAIVLAILVKTLLTGTVPSGIFAWIHLLTDIITVAVTIIVCAVPEGLPMLTSLLLSFQSIRMAKDHVLVRKIHGIETTGSLSLLFTDKTGTITEGRLSLVELVTGDGKCFHKLSQMTKELSDNVIVGIGLNNSALASEGKVIGGNNTDRALMAFLMESKMEDMELKLDKKNVLDFQVFDSSKKYSTITLLQGKEKVIYIKGAPEKILNQCQYYLDENGEEQVFHQKIEQELTAYMEMQASRCMRLLAVAKYSEENEYYTLISVLSIRDHVRKEAVEAIKEVKNAGVQVVMVTGDRKTTAMAIAKEAGLLCSEEEVTLTSRELAEKSDEEVKEILPSLRVVARALPMDKSRLVRLAQEMDYVVGMTGDGVNDSPALKKADVGFAMGSGTEVAKEAGDIIILDDNFKSIAKAILYGRTMFKNIRKFLVFQLTVNVAAVLTCFLGPLCGQNIVLTVIQLLFINLAIDTLAAIAFGSEPPQKEYMKEKPVGRGESIISKEMMNQIVIGALYITGISLAILFVQPLSQLFGNTDMTYLKSAMFAFFMMAITFNGFNARKPYGNPFKNLGKNRSFIAIMATILILQFIFVSFGGSLLHVHSLSISSWMISTLLAVLIIPIGHIKIWKSAC